MKQPFYEGFVGRGTARSCNAAAGMRIASHRAAPEGLRHGCRPRRHTAEHGPAVPRRLRATHVPSRRDHGHCHGGTNLGRHRERLFKWRLAHLSQLRGICLRGCGLAAACRTRGLVAGSSVTCVFGELLSGLPRWRGFGPTLGRREPAEPLATPVSDEDCPPGPGPDSPAFALLERAAPMVSSTRNGWPSRRACEDKWLRSVPGLHAI